MRMIEFSRSHENAYTWDSSNPFHSQTLEKGSLRSSYFVCHSLRQQQCSCECWVTIPLATSTVMFSRWLMCMERESPNPTNFPSGGYNTCKHLGCTLEYFWEACETIVVQSFLLHFASREMILVTTSCKIDLVLFSDLIWRNLSKSRWKGVEESVFCLNVMTL